MCGIPTAALQRGNFNAYLINKPSDMQTFIIYNMTQLIKKKCLYGFLLMQLRFCVRARAARLSEPVLGVPTFT